jgi:hypothetical protein
MMIILQKKYKRVVDDFMRCILEHKHSKTVTGQEPPEDVIHKQTAGDI